MQQHLERLAENFNPKTADSRFEQLLSQYELPVKALVHTYLEKVAEEEFEAFIGPRIGTEQISVTGKAVTDYRNGFRSIKQLIIDTLILNDFKMPRNRAGGFFPELFRQGVTCPPFSPIS